MNNHDSSISSVDTVSTADNILRSGCRILKKIAESTDKQNIVFSPFGISSALAITYNGALDETAREMSNVFGFAEVDRECSAYRNLINSLCLEEEGRTLKIANSLWIDREFTSVINDDFVNRGTESFSASIYHVDFKDEATTALVNAWVSNATQGKIDHLVKETQGVIVYQEQVMQIAQELAGYSLGEADLLRRAMGKKFASEMAKQRPRFVDGALERGVVPASCR